MQEMKRQCDGKRYNNHMFFSLTSMFLNAHTLMKISVLIIYHIPHREVYEYMKTRQREKVRLRSGKGENFSREELQIAREEYDQEATLFVFRLKSLKQGQSRSLLTQAARHHAAQVFFFFAIINLLYSSNWLIYLFALFSAKNSCAFSRKRLNHLRQ